MNTPNHDREPSPDIDDALKSIYQSPAPNAAFVDQLEQQLRERGATLAGHDPRAVPGARISLLRRWNMFWQRSRAALVNVAALAALAMLVVALMALFSNTKPTTTAPATSAPSGPMLTLHGSRLESSGPIGQRTVSIEVRASLPQVPDRVPLYDVQAALDQPSAELARSWAEKLGLTAVRLYQDTTVPEATYIAQADDGRFVRVGPGAQVVYQANVEALLVPGRSAPALDPQTAQTAAEAFLSSLPHFVVIEGHSAAKITFRVEPSPQQVAETRVFGLTFDYTVLIDGVPILARGVPSTITVDAEGRVRSAMLTPLRITPTGNEVTVQPVDAVVRAFLNNDPAVLRGSGWNSILTESANPSPSIYTRNPMFAVGDNVTLKGGVQHWAAVDGGTDLYFLSAVGTQSFILEGNGLNVSSTSVEIKGSVVGQARSGAWRIAVASIQPIETGPQAYADWTGTLHRQTDGAWLETDSGQKYLVPDPPADLADGARVEAPGAVIDEGDGRLRLEWPIIYRAQPTATAGSGGSGSALAVVRQVIVSEPTQMAPIEPTQVITAVEEPPQAAAVPAPVYPNGAPYSSGIFQSVTGSAGETIITPTLPVWWIYQPGDDVTLEGLLSAQVYRLVSTPSFDPSAMLMPDQTVFEAHLAVMNDDNKPDEMVLLTLVGDQVNLELIRLNGLHVRLQGRLLSSNEAARRYSDLIDKGQTGLALEVTHFEKARPAETKEVYSGRIQIETLDGKEAAIFSDTLSGQEYVLADSWTITYTLESYRRQAQTGATTHAIGVVAADRTFAGRPVMRLLESESSVRDSDEALKRIRARLDNPIQDIGPAPDAPQDVIVDRVELAYVFQLPPERAPGGFTASPTQLMYELTGHSSDGRFTVIYDLDATSPIAATIEPPLVPPASPAPTEPRTEILTYTVQAGDNLFSIAAQFNLQAETLLWANTDTLADNPHRVQPGVILNIMPVDGLYYRWRTYDDLAQVAQRFGVKAADILNWPGNHLDAASPIIEPGTMLIIPGGHRVSPPTPAPIPTPGEPVTVNPTTAPLAQPLTTEEQALDQVLKIDANIAVWDDPWSKDTLKLELNRITLTAFPSRSAEAAGSGEGFSPEVVADAGAVWRITITGTVRLSLPGIGSETTKYDGVTYVISQRHGGLLGVRAGKPIDSAVP